LIAWDLLKNYSNIVMGGDFNSLFAARSMRTMRSIFRDSAWFTPSLFRSSHLRQGIPLPVKVDYILLSKNLRYFGSKICRQSPGDHFPVITNISLH